MTLSAVQSFYIPAVSLTSTGVVLSNLDSTGLRIEWTISRDNTNKADSGEVTVFNLSPTFAGLIYDGWQAINQLPPSPNPPTFTLSVGWNLVPQLVFAGDIVNLIPIERTATDVRTRWVLGDGTEALRDSVIPAGFSNVKIDVLLGNLIPFPVASGGLGLTFPPESAALVQQALTEIPFQAWQNIPQGYSTRQAVDFIMETLGLEWRVHNGAFIAMRGGIINRPGPTISPSSGLIRYTPRDDGGIELEALADPRFEPGIRFTALDNLNVPIGSPSYRVESVVFTGSTDESSLMTVVGRRPLGLTTGLSIPGLAV